MKAPYLKLAGIFAVAVAFLFIFSNSRPPNISAQEDCSSDDINCFHYICSGLSCIYMMGPGVSTCTVGGTDCLPKCNGNSSCGVGGSGAVCRGKEDCEVPPDGCSGTECVPGGVGDCSGGCGVVWGCSGGVCAENGGGGPCPCGPPPSKCSGSSCVPGGSGKSCSSPADCIIARCVDSVCTVGAETGEPCDSTFPANLTSCDWGCVVGERGICARGGKGKYCGTGEGGQNPDFSACNYHCSASGVCSADGNHNLPVCYTLGNNVEDCGPRCDADFTCKIWGGSTNISCDTSISGGDPKCKARCVGDVCTVGATTGELCTDPSDCKYGCAYAYTGGIVCQKGTAGYSLCYNPATGGGDVNLCKGRCVGETCTLGATTGKECAVGADAWCEYTCDNDTCVQGHYYGEDKDKRSCYSSVTGGGEDGLCNIGHCVADPILGFYCSVTDDTSGDTCDLSSPFSSCKWGCNKEDQCVRGGTEGDCGNLTSDTGDSGKCKKGFCAFSNRNGGWYCDTVNATGGTPCDLSDPSMCTYGCYNEQCIRGAAGKSCVDAQGNPIDAKCAKGYCVYSEGQQKCSATGTGSDECYLADGNIPCNWGCSGKQCVRGGKGDSCDDGSGNKDETKCNKIGHCVKDPFGGVGWTCSDSPTATGDECDATNSTSCDWGCAGEQCVRGGQGSGCATAGNADSTKCRWGCVGIQNPQCARSLTGKHCADNTGNADQSLCDKKGYCVKDPDGWYCSSNSSEGGDACDLDNPANSCKWGCVGQQCVRGGTEAPCADSSDNSWPYKCEWGCNSYGQCARGHGGKGCLVNGIPNHSKCAIPPALAVALNSSTVPYSFEGIAGTSTAVFSWTYGEAGVDAVNETGYELQISENSGFDPLVVDDIVNFSSNSSLPPGSPNTHPVLISIAPATAVPASVPIGAEWMSSGSDWVNVSSTDWINFEKEYFWRVRTFAGANNASAWSDSTQTLTYESEYPHPAPNISFSASPSSVNVGDTVTLTDTSICYTSTSQYNCKDASSNTYEWNFGDGTVVSTKGTVTHKFKALTTVTLTITDEIAIPVSAVVSIDELKNIKNLPQWKETSPF